MDEVDTTKVKSEKNKATCKNYYNKKGKEIKKRKYERNEERIKKLIEKIESLGYKVIPPV